MMFQNRWHRAGPEGTGTTLALESNPRASRGIARRRGYITLNPRLTAQGATRSGCPAGTHYCGKNPDGSLRCAWLGKPCSPSIAASPSAGRATRGGRVRNPACVSSSWEEQWGSTIMSCCTAKFGKSFATYCRPIGLTDRPPTVPGRAAKPGRARATSSLLAHMSPRHAHREQNPTWPWVVGGAAIAGVGALAYARCHERLVSTDRVAIPQGTVTREIYFKGCFKELPYEVMLHGPEFHITSSFKTLEEAKNFAIEEEEDKEANPRLRAGPGVRATKCPPTYTPCGVLCCAPGYVCAGKSGPGGTPACTLPRSKRPTRRRRRRTR